MVEALRSYLLRLLAVPPEPQPPGGDTGHARVFRAAPAYLNYRLVIWGLKQLGALFGLVAATVAIYVASGEVDEPAFGIVMGILEGIAWGVFLLQLPVSLGITMLDYQLRWYILSDRALRVREGILSVREQTMTFANIQQVGIRQGPLQRLLGIADVHVTSAGGGGSGSQGETQAMGPNMHEVYFRGVDNAPEIRDAIRRRAHLHRDAGLGDPDDERAAAGELTGALDAARGLLSEVRALRSAMPARR
jgi:membrane protein YdbS with pleckstrin-like domain